MLNVMERIEQIADAEDVPVLGVGSAAEMADEPVGYRPGDVLPGAKSLVVFAIPVPRGVYRQAAPHVIETVWRTQSLYYRRLDALSVRFAALLEETGESAVPVFGCSPFALNERKDVRGHLNQLRMGEVAGIATRGRNGLLVHSRYGSRLMLGGLVTTACLPIFRKPDTDEPGCPPDCRVCINVCPAKAISPEKKRVSVMRCLNYTARTPLLPKLRFLALRALRPRAAGQLLSITSLDEHTLHVCSRCVTLCPYGEGMQ